jgi:hypothetical protein
MTKNNEPTIASSVLKTTACENLVTEAELKDTVDKPLEEVLNAKAEREEDNEQGNRS